MADPSQFKYTAGLNHVGSYQASARPYVKTNLTVPTSGAANTSLEIAFPKVTKFVTIRNDGIGDSGSCNMQLAFATGGFETNQSNFITVAESASFSADFRITRLYLMSAEAGELNATVIAGLTNIDASHLTSSWEHLEGVSTLV